MSTRVESNEAMAIDVEKIKLLGSRERLEILNLLMKEGPMSWTTIEKKLKLNPNSLNFHLNKLVNSELVVRNLKENENGHPGTEYKISEQGKRDLINLPRKEAR